MQARVWISNTKSCFQRYFSSVAEKSEGQLQQGGRRRCMSKLAAGTTATKNNSKDRRGVDQYYCSLDTCLWVPHPRTGIYYPKGHEKVMEDVPNGAASFNRTYWIRSLDGVDNIYAPDTDYNSDIYNF